MKRVWLWLVLLAVAAAATVVMVAHWRSVQADGGPSVSESEMPSAAEFEQVPPTGSEMNLDKMDVSFGRGTNGVDRGKTEAAP